MCAFYFRIMNRVSAELVQEALILFRSEKPIHFTNFEHCEECAEHDATLLNSSIESIGLSELGSPGWDPICFTHCEGKKYYMPAFVRLSFETMHKEFYLGQFLFHLEGDGVNNSLFLSCTPLQRAFISKFLLHVIEVYSGEVEKRLFTDQILRVYAIWRNE